MNNNEKIVCKRIGDGSSILLALDTGHYYSLNNTAALAWDLIKSGIPLGEIESQFAEMYAVDNFIISRDLEDFLESLRANKLLSGIISDNDQKINFADLEISEQEYVRPEIRVHEPIQDITAGSGDSGGGGGGYTYYYYYYY